MLGGTTGGAAGRERLAEPGLGDRAGDQVALTVAWPCQSATCTAQSSRGGSENSRVPSSGSTIQTRSRVEPDLVVLALLGQHGVARSVLGEQLHEQLVGGQVAGVLELAALEPLLADLEQAAAGGLGQPARQHVVVGVGGGRPGSKVTGTA